ncbi:MAG: hypothetical protein WCI20_11405 [bacterium]
MKPRALSALILFLFASTVCLATDFKAGEAYVLSSDQVVTNELWLQARTITFAGQAKDDCFLLADSVNQGPLTNLPSLRLPGVFLADVWAAGETVEANGTLANHARLAAMKTLMIAGSVGRNLIALAPTITLATNACIGGNALLVGQDIIVNGSVSGNTRIIGSTVTLAGQFNGDISVTATDLNVMPGTRIAGNLIYRMDRDLVLDSRVDLGGKIMKAELLNPKGKATPETSGSLLLQLGLLCGAIMVGLVFVSLMPGIVSLSVHKLAESFWRCTLYGFITFALVPLSAFFLLFTLAGIPLSVILILAYVILMYVSKIIVGLYVGHLLLRRKTPIPPTLLFPVMALGLLILYAATTIPFPVGLIAWFSITLAGMGALMGALLDRRIPIMVNYPPDSRTNPPPLPGNFPPGAV